MFVIDNKERLETFLKTEDEEVKKIKEELLSETYIDEYHNLDFIDEDTELNLENIRNKYPIVSKEIIQEVKSRSGGGLSELKKIISEIYYSKPVVVLDKINFTTSISFDSFHCNQGQVGERFENILDALNFYLLKRDYLEEKNSKIKRIEKHLERQLKKVSSKINDLRGLIDRGSKEEEYKRIGNLLLINLKDIKPGLNEITLEDIYNEGKDITIKLNPKLSPKENTDWYFDKSKSDRILIQKSEKLLRLSQIEFEKLKKSQNNLSKLDSIKEINLLMKDLKMKENEKKSQMVDIKIKFKRYKIMGKYDVFVGKDSVNNDLLTTKFAKQNDYWFHARSVSGSHVVLRVENTKEGISKRCNKKSRIISGLS